MATEFKVPDLGENVDEGDIVSVMVKEGDQIEADQNVMEIETGKAVVELPCPIAGRITKVHVQKGSKVKVGDPLLTVDAVGRGAAKQERAPAPEAKAETKNASPVVEKKQATATAQEAAEPEEVSAEEDVAEERQQPASKSGADGQAKKPAARPKSAASTAVEAAPTGKTPPAGPATRRLARELGVDLSAVNGSGPHGRITEDDVKAAVRESVAAPRAPVE